MKKLATYDVYEDADGNILTFNGLKITAPAIISAAIADYYQGIKRHVKKVQQATE